MFPLQKKNKGMTNESARIFSTASGTIFMTCRNNQLADSVDRFRCQQTSVVSNSPPFEVGSLVAGFPPARE
jgi:hypothetical protein